MYGQIKLTIWYIYNMIGFSLFLELNPDAHVKSPFHMDLGIKVFMDYELFK